VSPSPADGLNEDEEHMYERRQAEMVKRLEPHAVQTETPND